MNKYEHGGDIYEIPGVARDFSISCNPLGMPDAVARALKSNTRLFSMYPDPRCRKLRTAISDYLSVQEEMILCGNGSADLINRICACFRPSRALVTAPSFSDYERCVEVFGGKVTEYPLYPEEGFNVSSSILDYIDDSMDMVFLCTPNNPTGQLIDSQLLYSIAKRCEETDTIFVLDECFLPFTGEKSMAHYSSAFPHMLILRAFTKIYSMAGIRLGHLIGSESLIKKIAPFGAEWSVSAPAQVCGTEALNLEPEWSRRTREYVSHEKKFMTEKLTEAGLRVFPPAANFILAESPVSLANSLLEYGLMVRDCSNFSGLDEHYIRIGLLDHESNRELAEAIKEILDGR